MSPPLGLVRGPGGSEGSQASESESGGAGPESEGSFRALESEDMGGHGKRVLVGHGGARDARMWSSQRQQEWHRFLGLPRGDHE